MFHRDFVFKVAVFSGRLLLIVVLLVFGLQTGLLLLCGPRSTDSGFVSITT